MAGFDSPEHPADDSPRRLARIGGTLYLSSIVLGASEEIFVGSRLVVAADAAATAANIRASEWLWRLGIDDLPLCPDSPRLRIVHGTERFAAP